jgi:hypothetical protein
MKLNNILRSLKMVAAGVLIVPFVEQALIASALGYGLLAFGKTPKEDNNFVPVGTTWTDGNGQKWIKTAQGEKSPLDPPPLGGGGEPPSQKPGDRFNMLMGMLLLAMAGGFFDEAEASPQQGDPLLLDLNGDGIKTTSYENGLLFDHDGNGFVSWQKQAA